MNSQWLPEKKAQTQLEHLKNSSLIARHYCLSQYWERLMFCDGYKASSGMSSLIVPTEFGNMMIQQCSRATGISPADSLLALYGHFYWLDILIDCERSDINGLIRALNDDLAADRVRIANIWGRELEDRLAAQPQLLDATVLPHNESWRLLNGIPTGVFQHGFLISGPFGITEGVEHRWLPITHQANVYYLQGSERHQRAVTFDVANIDIVKAHRWLDHTLSQMCGSASEWMSALAWHGSTYSDHQHNNYSDIPSVIGDCVFDSERTLLLESVLKTDAASIIRKTLKSNTIGKPFASLPPADLAVSLNSDQQFQILLSIESNNLVEAIDSVVLSGKFEIPASELRHSRKRVPAKGICFSSELSSLGIRPAHPQSFASLCSAILRAYKETDSSSELAFRLGSDPSRGLQVSLTDFVRREGPSETVTRLILASHSVTTVICRELGLKLSEVTPRTASTIPRILWKMGFEIPRHDEILDRLNRRIQQFEDLVSCVDFQAGETAKEKIRSEGVNLFVSVEEFLDRILAFNAWMLTSDHWGQTRYEYRISDARLSVSELLGSDLDSPEGSVHWNASGENALGTQLIYLGAFEQWLESLGSRDRCIRRDLDVSSELDRFQRPFPFKHTQLWADSDLVELERYREIFKKTLKTISQADVAGVRNALDHQRDGSRFPTLEKLDLCVSKLKVAVRLAEQSRVYPVSFWFESSVEKVFGATEYVFCNNRSDRFSIYRPSTVSSLPPITRINPVIFAPVNFLGAADSLLSFKLMGESNYSRMWASFPRISRTLPEVEANQLSASISASDSNPGSQQDGSDLSSHRL